MAVAIQGRYLGGFGVEVEHQDSGTVLRTAAPLDNRGDGSSFSPTDLLAASLGSCMVTLMAIVGEQEGLSLEGVSFRALKEMAASPRRVARVSLTITMPRGLTAEQRELLEQAALTCPVKCSLPAELETPVTFVYPESEA